MVELSEEIISRIISRCKRIGECVERYHQRHKLTDCLTKNYTIMTKNYYRNEYTEQQWIALINKAIEFGCKIEYSIYDNIVTIDSTDLETAPIKNSTNSISKARDFWADEIHGIIQDSAERVK